MKVLVIGSLNTDIIGLGFERLLRQNELGTSEELFIGPGGKGRNMAQMIATLSNPGDVAMLGATVKDKYNLWEPPITALSKSGVDTSHIHFLENETKVLPGIAMIPIDKQGNNQIYLNHGANAFFTPDILEQKTELFDELAADKGVLLITLGIPNLTAIKAIKIANERNIKVLLDPGDAIIDGDFVSIFKEEIYLIKPNEFEVEQITGLRITDFESAKNASQKIFELGGIENLFITHGEQGGYYFEKDVDGVHYKIEGSPRIISTVGAGDQTMAVLTKMILDGHNLDDSIKASIKAGTWQCEQKGIVPMGKEAFRSMVV